MTIRRAHLPALGAYALLTGAWLWPSVAHFRDRPMIGTGDSSVFMWAWWAMPRAIADGHNPFTSDLIFHPVGADLSLTTTAPLVSLVTTPVRLLFGATAQVNAAQLGATWLAAISAYFLALRLCQRRGPAFLAGMAYEFAPFRFVHLADHLNLVHTAFLPLGGLALLRLLERPTTWRGAQLGMVLGAAFLTEPQLAVLTAAVVIPLAVVERAQVTRAHRRPLVVAGMAAIVVAAPLLLPLLGGLAGGESNTVAARSMVPYSSDVTRWLLPPVSHPVLGGPSEWIGGFPADEGLAYPGLLVLGLGIAAVRLVPGRERRGWVAVGLVGFVLSLGPFLSIHGRYLGIPLPFLVVGWLPGLSAFRVPGRFVLVAVLALDLLAALGLAALAAKHPGKGRALIAAALAVVLFELWPGAVVDRSDDVPVPYRAIAADAGDGAVLELPLQWSTGEVVIGDRLAGRDDTIFMTYALEHEHPIVGGSVSRYPDRRLDQLLAEPVYQQILALQGDPGYDATATFDEADLRALDVGYVVYHRDRPLPAALRYVESLDLDVLADDGTVIVWRVDT